MRRLIIIAVPALVAGILCVPAAAAPGPPSYESSDPAPGEKTHSKTTEVSVTFNEILDPSSAELTVSACGETVDDGGPPTVTMETISIGVGENPIGTYTVAYTVSGADDTPEEKVTPTEGSYTFSYHSKQCGGSEEPGDGNGDGHGHHDGGQGDGGKDHGEHEGKHSETKHGGNGPGGHDGENHGSASHTDHTTAGGTEHSGHQSTSDHSTGSHKGGHHKKGNGGHSGSGQGHKHSGGHDGKGHNGEPGDAGGNKPAKPSPPNEVVNLLLVLLIPAAMGAAGGRMLRKSRIRPAH